MPTFAYSAHGPSGIVNGTLAASDRGEALRLLGKQRLQPFKLEVAAESEGPSTGQSHRPWTSRKQGHGARSPNRQPAQSG